MRIGIQCVTSEGFVPPVRQAVVVKDFGFESIYTGEHRHMPLSTPTPDFYADTGVPDFYRYTPDPFITLAAMSVAAPGLVVGTSILIAPIHDTLTLANQIGTLDRLTGGRTVLGLGIGWNRPELADHGVDFDTRLDKLAEQLRAMKRMWANETAGFEGRFVRFEESWHGPKPVQTPHPPFLFGGRLLKRNLPVVAGLCDGWLPGGDAARAHSEAFEAELKALAEAVRAQGRDPASLKNAFLFSDLMITDRDPAAYAAAAPTREDFARLETLGFDRVIVGAPASGEDHLLGALSHLSRVAAPWLFQG